jgi:hypothetical protein
MITLRSHRGALAAIVGAVLLAACAAPPRPSPAAPPPAPLDVSYDWHVLLAAPFGSLLKDVPLTLHEVLVFRDEAHGPASADEAECFALNGSPPRFLTRVPEEFLLCYSHDRLSRVEATVRLPAAQAAQILADACGLWTNNAKAQSAEGAGAENCSGSDGGVHFSGRLEDDAEHADTLLLVRIDGPTSPDKPATPDR